MKHVQVLFLEGFCAVKKKRTGWLGLWMDMEQAQAALKGGDRKSVV